MTDYLERDFEMFNEDTNGGMYVNKRALVPVPQFAVCLEASDVSQSIAARAAERNLMTS